MILELLQQANWKRTACAACLHLQHMVVLIACTACLSSVPQEMYAFTLSCYKAGLRGIDLHLKVGSD